MIKYFERLEPDYDMMIRHSEKMFEESYDKVNMMLFENHYLTEDVSSSFADSIKKFFTELILAFKNFGRSLKEDMDYAAREKDIKVKLKNLRENLNQKYDEGNNYVYITDVWAYQKEYEKAVKDLDKFAKRFTKTKYQSTFQIDDDLMEFYDRCDKYDKKLDELSEKKIKVDLVKAIEFVEAELRGDSFIFQSINDYTRELEGYKRSAETLNEKYRALGAKVIPKHVSLIKQCTTRISKFIRKHAAKFIAKTVFYFA